MLFSLFQLIKQSKKVIDLNIVFIILVNILYSRVFFIVARLNTINFKEGLYSYIFIYIKIVIIQYNLLLFSINCLAYIYKFFLGYLYKLVLFITKKQFIKLNSIINSIIKATISNISLFYYYYFAIQNTPQDSIQNLFIFLSK